MDQRGNTYSKGGTTILEPRQGQLHAEPRCTTISCNVASLSWQEPEEELIILLLMKVSDRDRNVKGKNVGCVKLISNLFNNYLPTKEYVSCDLGDYNSAVLIKTSTN